MTGSSLPTGSVTFLFTDVEGSTKLWDAHREVMGAALRTHDDMVRKAIETHHGYVFKTIGDAFCAAFQSPADAVSAAVEAQRVLAARDWGEVGAIRVRIALHTGEAEERDRDYFGPTVNRVARLLAAGHGGQVLLSRTAAAELSGDLTDGIGLRDMGDRRLKDLTEPERVYQLVAPGLGEDFPPLKSLDARPNNLPVQPTELLGRETELAAVKERLRVGGARLLTLTGPGGTGKTRLALQIAADLIDDFPHGVWFVDLSAVSDSALVPAEIAGALDVREEGGDPIDRQLRAFLRDKELLLVLDNFEQVLPAAKQLAALRSECPGVKLLVTSRAPLRISGEKEYPVPPLGVPDTRRLPDPEHLLAYPAVELFVQRAASVKHDFALTAANAPAVAEICVALDGLPLAIELAAARVRILPPQAMLAKLENRLKLLTGGARDKAERQQTLRNTIAWSHDLLPEAERILFARLSGFAGGCTVEAAESICNPDGDLDLLEGLEQLVQHSLVRQDALPDGEPRLRMLATIREFAAEQLDESGEAEPIRQAHAGYFLNFAEQAEPELTGRDQITWLGTLEREHDNLRAALRRFLDTTPEEALRLAAALWRFWWTRGHLSEGRQWLEGALERSLPIVCTSRAVALDGVGALVETQGDFQLAKGYHESALDMWRELGDNNGMSRSLANLANVFRKLGAYEDAKRLYEELLASDRSAGDERGIAMSLYDLGIIAMLQNDDSRAKGLISECLTLFSKLGDRRGEAGGLCALGILAFHSGDYVGSEKLHSQSLAIWRDLDDRPGTAAALIDLGHAVQQQGDYQRAAELYEAGLVLYEELGDKAGCGFALAHLGRLLFTLGESSRGQSMLLRGLQLSFEVGDQVGTIEGLESFAGVAERRGDLLIAAQILGAAESLREQCSAPLPAAHSGDITRIADAARVALNPTDFDAAWSTGRSMPLEEAVSLALTRVA